MKEENAAVNPLKPAEYVPDSSHGSKGDSDQITRDYLDSMLLVFRHIGSKAPDSTTTLFGKASPTPIMASGLALLEKIYEDGAAEFAKGILRANTVMWTGWIGMEMFKRVCDTGVRAVCGVKPFQDMERVHRAIEEAAGAGAEAVCMDIDHCFDDTGKDCAFVFGQLARKTEDDLRGFIKTAHENKIAFILKGILDPIDAVKAKELGADGIVVSHHFGIWCYAAPPAMMLPEIRKTVGWEYPVYADCGVHSGVDVFKYLATGAAGVGVARELMTAFRKNGADGVYDRLMFMNDELLGTMAKTGRTTIADIDLSAIKMRIGW